MFVWLILAITAAGCLAAVDGEGASAEENCSVKECH
jgi:hypothetical protein